MLIKASYVNVILSQLEALGLTQLEFMYLGVPVITSAVGGQRWLIRNGIEGLHVKGFEDIRGTAAAITRLVDDPTIWSQLSRNAQKRAKPLTLSSLTAELNKALTEQLMKERGLVHVPREVRGTLAEP